MTGLKMAGFRCSPKLRKIPATIKIQSALPPPPQNPKYPPPFSKEEFLDMEDFLQKERRILGAHKIGAAISGPRIADKNCTDTRIFSEKKTSFVSTAPLLKEVSEKVAKFETKFPKFSPKFAPKFSVLSWQVEKSSPQIQQIFPIENFEFQIKFQIKFHQKFHKHTSAGLAALTFCDLVFITMQPLGDPLEIKTTKNTDELLQECRENNGTWG